MNTIQPRLHLTTSERAMLSLFFTALLTGGYTAVDAISNPGNIDWRIVITIAIVTAAGTFGHTGATYLSTHGYLPLGTIVEAGTSAIEKRLEPEKRQFVVLPPALSLASRVDPIVLPVQTVPPMTQGNTPPENKLEGTIQTPVVTPPFINPPPSQQ